MRPPSRSFTAVVLVLLAATLLPSILAATEPVRAPRWVEPEFRLNNAVTVWDPIAEQLLLFRQLAPGDPIQVWSFRWGASPQWQPRQPTGPSPTLLVAGMSVAYDARARRVIAVAPSRWSGESETEVWSLTLEGGIEWKRIVVSGIGPTSRLQPSIAVLQGPTRLLLFGGMTTLPAPGIPGGPDYRDDIWLLHLGEEPLWTELKPAGPLPPKRRDGAFAADSQSHLAVLLGGYFQIAPSTNEAWVFSLDDTVWSPLVAEGDAPTNTKPHAFLLDPKREAFVVVTSGAEHVRTDILRLGATPRWEALPLADAPVARTGGIAHLDLPRDRLVLAGGLGPNGESLDHVWACDLDATAVWETLTPGADRPSARSFQAGVWVAPLGSVAYLGGAIAHSSPGSFSRVPDSNLWMLSLSGTRPRWSVPPLPDLPELGDRSSPELVYDSKRSRLVALIEPGSSGPPCGPCNRAWTYDVGGESGWKEIEIEGTEPEIYPLGSFYDPRRDRIIVVSRRPQGDLEIWALPLETPAQWLRLDSGSQAPPPRDDARVVLDEPGDRVVMYGGTLSGSGWRLTDTWTFDLCGSGAWSEIKTIGAPPPGAEAACFDLLRRRLLIFSRLPSSPATFGVFELDLGGEPIWRQVEPSGVSPRPTYYAPAVYDPRGDRVVIFGGSQPTGDAPASVDLLWYLELGSPILDVELTLNAGAEQHFDPPTGRARFHVAILSAPNFDARSVDPTSVLFEGAPAIDEPGGGRRMGRERDVNGDGLPDLSLGFQSDHVAHGTQSVMAMLTGQTLDGRRIEGRVRLADPGRHPLADGSFDAEPVGTSMRVEPNPTAGSIRVRFNLADDAPARIEIFDLGGRRIQSIELTGRPTRQHETAIRVPENTPNGLYWIRLTQAGRAVLARIIVAR